MKILRIQLLRVKMYDGESSAPHIFFLAKKFPRANMPGDEIKFSLKKDVLPYCVIIY